jgi:hypothetical protein
MNYPSKFQVSEWPKYINANCPHCNEFVPRGNKHVCDDPKPPQNEPVKEKL